MLGALFDAVHRRITAFVLLIWNGAVLVLSLLIAAIGALMEIGWLPRTKADTYASWQNWSMIALLVVAAVIAFEGVGWAWWQMRVSREEFFAARGWRSPPWRVFSALRQRLGLPAYISNFGRGRMSLSIIYFLAAILNMGLVALLVIPFMIFSIEQGAPGASVWLLAALGFASLVVLNFIGLGALLQNIAAARATKLYQRAREWDGRPPILFLRAFNQDSAKLKAASRDPLVNFLLAAASPARLTKSCWSMPRCTAPSSRSAIHATRRRRSAPRASSCRATAMNGKTWSSNWCAPRTLS